MKKVALDIDDVLAEFYPGICDRLDIPEVAHDIWAPEGNEYIIEEHKLITSNADHKFWLDLGRTSNPKSITFKVEAYITSSPKKFLNSRKAWLVRNGFPEAPVYHSRDKASLMKTLGIDILVDDKISTIEKVNSSGLIGLQFKPPYMTKEFSDSSKVITHLSQVNKFL